MDVLPAATGSRCSQPVLSLFSAWRSQGQGSVLQHTCRSPPSRRRPSSRHPCRTQAHFPYASAVLKESMRLYPPSITLMREAPASGPWQLGSYDVPAGTALQVGRVGPTDACLRWHASMLCSPG